MIGLAILQILLYWESLAVSEKCGHLSDPTKFFVVDEIQWKDIIKEFVEPGKQPVPDIVSYSVEWKVKLQSETAITPNLMTLPAVLFTIKVCNSCREREVLLEGKSNPELIP